jgi:hypothetical protein
MNRVIGEIAEDFNNLTILIFQNSQTDGMILLMNLPFFVFRHEIFPCEKEEILIQKLLTN